MAETERKSHLPYLAPLARVIPLVYDQSISYYEFLNKLYQAVDEALQTMDEAIEAADKVNIKLDNFRKELDGIKAEIEARMSRAETVVEGFDGRMSLIEDSFGKLSKYVDDNVDFIKLQIDSLRGAFESERNITDRSFMNIATEMGGAFNTQRIYKPDLTDSPKLYKGPGTLSETKGDIPALAQFIDDLGDRIDEEIQENIEPRIRATEDTLAELKAPYFKKTDDVIVVGGELAAEYTWTTTYGAIKNREFILYMGCSDAESYLAGANCSMTVSVAGGSPVSIYIGKTGGTAQSPIQASYNRKPFLRLNFMEDRGRGKALVLHEFNVSTSQNGIYDGIAQFNTRNSDHVPEDAAEIVITVSPQVGNIQNEAYGVLFEKTITR